jgi:biotin transport system substrate-specific component
MKETFVSMSNRNGMRAITTTLERPVVKNLGATLALAALTAALAQISFKLPITPVPFTLQVLGATLSGLLLGSRLGAIAQLEYLAVGLAGAPVFAHWSGGPAALLSSSGGYIPGFIAQAFVTGLLFERCHKKDAPQAFVAGMAGVGVLYCFGVSWLTVWLNAFGKSAPGLWAWLLGAAPFIGIDALKVTVATMTVTGIKLWKK